MAQRDLLKRYLDAGMALTSMTKTRAEAIVRELVKAGELHRDQFQQQVDELIDRSRRNSDHLVALVRKEVTSQLSSVRDELKALERRLSEQQDAAGGGAANNPAAVEVEEMEKVAPRRAPAASARPNAAATKVPARPRATKDSPSAPAEKAPRRASTANVRRSAAAKKETAAGKTPRRNAADADRPNAD